MIWLILREFSLLGKVQPWRFALLYFFSTVVWSVQKQLSAQEEAVALIASLLLCKALWFLSGDRSYEASPCPQAREWLLTTWPWNTLSNGSMWSDREDEGSVCVRIQHRQSCDSKQILHIPAETVSVHHQLVRPQRTTENKMYLSQEHQRSTPLKCNDAILGVIIMCCAHKKWKLAACLFYFNIKYCRVINLHLVSQGCSSTCSSWVMRQFTKLTMIVQPSFCSHGSLYMRAKLV